MSKDSSRVLEFDARVKIALALCFGILTWYAGPIGLGLYGVGLYFICAALGDFWHANKKAFRAYGLFVIFWTALKFLLDVVGGARAETPLGDAFSNAALLGVRLLILVFIGLCLAQATSPRKLGLALSWALRPFLGKRAWKTALACGLMIHFLPLAWSTISRIRETMSRRCGALSRLQRAALLPKAALRVLSQKTWTQTLGIAARGLDTPAAWEPDFPLNPRAWVFGLMLAVVGLLAAGL